MPSLHIRTLTEEFTLADPSLLPIGLRTPVEVKSKRATLPHVLNLHVHGVCCYFSLARSLVLQAIKKALLIRFEDTSHRTAHRHLTTPLLFHTQTRYARKNPLHEDAALHSTATPTPHLARNMPPQNIIPESTPHYVDFGSSLSNFIKSDDDVVYDRVPGAWLGDSAHEEFSDPNVTRSKARIIAKEALADLQRAAAEAENEKLRRHTLRARLAAEDREQAAATAKGDKKSTQHPMTIRAIPAQDNATNAPTRSSNDMIHSISSRDILGPSSQALLKLHHLLGASLQSLNLPFTNLVT